MHKSVRGDIRYLSFPSSNFDEEYRGEDGRTQQCMNYGEAASAITIDFDVDHFFKKLYRGFDVAILTWLPYKEDDELIFPFKFRFESGCSDEIAAVIFNTFIKPCVLPSEFHHGQRLLHPGQSSDLRVLQPFFCGPSVQPRPTPPPRLFFENILKPREDVSDVLEASRIFQLGSDLPSFSLHD